MLENIKIYLKVIKSELYLNQNLLTLSTILHNIFYVLVTYSLFNKQLLLKFKLQYLNTLLKKVF